MMLRRITILLLSTCFACEDLTDKKLMPQPLSVVVVDGVITSQELNHKIHLSQPYELQNGIGTPVTGAVVTLSADNNTVALTEYPSESGDYYTPVLKAVTNKTYTLTITINGKTYTAVDTPPAVEPLEEFHYGKSNDDYTLAFSASGSAANYIQYAMDWTATDGCISGANCRGEAYYYDLKTADVNEIFKPNSEIFRFPAGTTVIRKKYSVSSAYRNFLRSMLSETEWHGGTFDVQPGPVETNISGGALGFFAVSTVVSDTILVGK